MRKLLWIVTLFVTALSFSSCEKPYDDTEIWNSVNSLEQRMTAMETVVNAYEKKLFIESVTQIENGYIICFSDDSKATIINGKDGINGTDGKDGLDGAPGKDGLDGAPGKDGDTYIEGITIGENEVTFKLTDGKQFSIPLYSSLSIKFDTESIVMASNSTREVQYTVESILNDISIEVISSADIKAKAIVDKDNSMTGRIEIKFGATIDEYSKVVVLVSNGEKVIMKTLKFEQEEIKVFDETNISVSEKGGEVELLYLSNVECEVIIPDSVDWISISPATKALEQRSIKLLLEENKGAAREAVVTLQNKDASLKLEYTISQNPNNEYQHALEREALIAIYNALDGDNWTNNTNWCSDKPVSEWVGVGTDGNNFIEHLNLMQQYTPMKGKIPADIGNLTHLKSLTLWLYESDGLSDNFGNLKYLESLEIWIYNTIDGNKSEFPLSLCNCTNLKYLNISNISGEIPTEISKLRNLETLRMWNISSKLPDEIGDLCSLIELDIEGNDIGEIPHTIGNLKKLEKATLRNISGMIPDEIGELTQLKWLDLYGDLRNSSIPKTIGNCKSLEVLVINMSGLTGVIPEEISNCTNLTEINLSSNNLKGNIPTSIGNLKKLECLDLSKNRLNGSIPSSLKNCSNLKYLYLNNNNLSSSIPESLGMLPLNFITLYDNALKGNIPNSLTENKKLWELCWCYIYHNNSFSNPINVKAIDFEVKTINNKTINSNDVYNNNKFTLLYLFSPPPHNDFNKSNEVKELYNKYHDKGLEIIGYTSPHYDLSSVIQYVEEENFVWDNILPNNENSIFNPIYEKSRYVKEINYPINSSSSFTLVDSTGNIITYSTWGLGFINAILANNLGNENINIYISQDYSLDGKVTILQNATKGDGIDIVLMGDAYSDRQIADGTYDADMKHLYNNLFTEEPYKSFKDHFNVYYVNVVSATEGYEYGNTALDSYFCNGTQVGGNDNAVFNYALKAISEEEMDEALLIVAMNSDNYAGTCYMYYPESVSGTYGSGPSVAYFPRGGDAETFAQLLHHEACGHGFAKLADEYAYEDMGSVPSDYVSEIQTQQNRWGWWKNVDFTSNPTATRWSHFINDSRYQYEGLGAFEGGLTYWSGVWRPTENSIMRSNTGGFNAPSREAIYYRIHKLAYGDSWEYDYEEFVEWDAKNRKTEASATRAPYRIEKPKDFKPTAPPVVINKNWRDVK